MGEYLDNNLLRIEKQLKFINWNLGKITAYLLKDLKLINKIVEAETEENGN